MALLLKTSPVRAASAGTGDDSTYQELVKRVIGGDLSVDFRALRFACLKADSCDPKGDSKDLVSARQAMQKKDYAKAAKSCEALVAAGFVNIEAHAICSRAYTELNEPGKAKLHHDVTSALLRSIFSSGDGKGEKTAFEVIGTHEEYVVLSVMGLPFLGAQSLITRKQHSFDSQERVDPKTGQTVIVYFNIDAFFPMKLN